MISGARNWARTDLFYAQAKKDAVGNIIPNSSVEEMLYKDDVQDMGATNRNLWLETCGFHAVTNADVSRLKDPDTFEKYLRDTFKGLRFPDLLTNLANTPQYYLRLRLARPGLDPHVFNGSEVPQYHGPVLEELVGHKSEFQMSLSWSDAVKLVRGGASLVKCLINPGHYIALVAFDDIKQEFIALDSRAYIEDNWCSRYGFTAYTTNMRSFADIFSPEAI